MLDTGHAGDGAHSMAKAAHRFAEEDDVGLDEPPAVPAPDDLGLFDGGLHLRAVETLATLDAVLVRERAVRLDDVVHGDARLAFEGVDVLRETCVEQCVVGEELDEGVGKRGPELARVQLAGEGIDCWARFYVRKRRIYAMFYIHGMGFSAK